MSRRRKVAISVPAVLLDEVERRRKQTGETRSAVFERALEAYLAAERHVEASRQYVAGYRRVPETRAEVQAALVTAMAGLTASISNETW